MRSSSFALCILLAGCASHQAVPVASAQAGAAPLRPDQSLEIRHMYLFTPGKDPVLVVQRDDASSAPQEISAELPQLR